MDKQKLLSRLRRAVTDYNMIKAGDKIAVGVSGGKDSMVLLSLLANYRIFSKEPFELMAVIIDMGLTQEDIFAPIKEYCKTIDVPCLVEKTEIGPIIFEERKETNPCSLCSKMRRGALNTVLNRYGFNKLALGHHADDVIDTFMLSLMFEHRLSTFAPISYLDRTDVTVIRPLLYIFERDLIGFSKTLPVVKNPCPADKFTKREEMKQFLAKMQESYPDVKEKLFNAIAHPDRYNLWDKVKPQ